MYSVRYVHYSYCVFKFNNFFVNLFQFWFLCTFAAHKYMYAYRAPLYAAVYKVCVQYGAKVQLNLHFAFLVDSGFLSLFMQIV